MPQANAPAATSTTLGPGDLIEVRVFEEADLSGPYRVAPGGTIDFPLCGKVQVGGSEHLRHLRHADPLPRGEVPQASPGHGPSARVQQQEIFVFGEVQKPGTFPYEEDMSIIQAITMAGGFTKVASKNDIAVTRQVEGKETKIRVPVADIGTGRERNFRLQPGDIVFVPESIF